MRALDGRNNVKVYNLSAGKSLPEVSLLNLLLLSYGWLLVIGSRRVGIIAISTNT